jgi:hypothetical protein
MMQRPGRRLASDRQRGMITLLAVMVPLVALCFTSSASANPYTVFEQCPIHYPVPEVRFCLYGTITSGEFAIGSTKVPINKTITIQGGLLQTEELAETEPQTFILLPAKNGESLSKTELNVPGGLLDIVKCEEIKGSGRFEAALRKACEALFESKLTGVTATTEPAATATNPAILSLHNLFGEQGSALTLPVKIHLKNPLLGNSCFIGSESHPIELHLMTGVTEPPAPNKPIEGFVGEEGEEGEGGIFTVHPLKLVDNAFSVPTAEGCGELLGFRGFLDGLVNAKLGLESKAGHNTAILQGEQKLASVEVAGELL